MAKLPDLTLAITLELVRQLLNRIDEIAALEWHLSENFNETELLLTELDNLQNIRERANDAYTRLNTLLQRLAEAQPQASSAMLELLQLAISQAEATIAAATGTIQDVKRDLEQS